MKKFTLAFAMLAISIIGFGQAVADNALIPISITLNSILRMNVTSGGNIDFTVNTLDQYENGIENSPRYTTQFTVASSTNFKVDIYAEDDEFVGSDDVSHTMALDLVGYTVSSDGSYTDGSELDLSVVAGGGANYVALTSSELVLVQSNSGNAGDISANAFSILWELGTTAVAGAGNNSGATTLKAANLPSDRYATNVFLVLSAE